MPSSTKYDCKRRPDRRSKLRYRLRAANVWISDSGFHHTVVLDTHFDGRAQRPLDEDLRRYLVHRRIQPIQRQFARRLRWRASSLNLLSAPVH
jgi:hypothetical protein